MPNKLWKRIRELFVGLGRERPSPIAPPPVPARATFTPCFDWLVARTGSSDLALVYGLVWRYCQRREGRCTASLGTLAATLHWSRQRLARHLARLVALGLLRRVPSERGAPHVYVLPDDTPLRQADGHAVTPRITPTHRRTPPPVAARNTRNTRSPSEDRETREERGSGIRGQGAERRHIPDPCPPTPDPSRTTPATGPPASATDAAERWAQALARLRAELGEEAYATWLAESAPYAYSHGLLVVGLRSPYAVDWVQHRYSAAVEAAVAAAWGEKLLVRYMVRRNRRA